MAPCANVVVYIIGSYGLMLLFLIYRIGFYQLGTITKVSLELVIVAMPCVVLALFVGMGKFSHARLTWVASQAG